MHFYLIILQVFFNFHSAFSDSTQLLPNFPLSSPISVDTANNFIDTGIDFVLKTPAVPPQAKAVIAVGAALKDGAAELNRSGNLTKAGSILVNSTIEHETAVVTNLPGMSIVKGIGVVGNGIRNGNDASTILANGAKAALKGLPGGDFASGAITVAEGVYRGKSTSEIAKDVVLDRFNNRTNLSLPKADLPSLNEPIVNRPVVNSPIASVDVQRIDRVSNTNRITKQRARPNNRRTPQRQHNQVIHSHPLNFRPNPNAYYV